MGYAHKEKDLIFPDFSYVNAEGKFNAISNENSAFLLNYLAKTYDAVGIEVRRPYLLVSCTSSIPGWYGRPDNIAGLTAVWLVHDVDQVPGNLLLGDFIVGPVQGTVLSFGRAVLAKLKSFATPSSELMLHLFYYLQAHLARRGLVALTYNCHTLIAELPLTDPLVYKADLAHLPCRISGTDVRLAYNNGTIEDGHEFLDSQGHKTAVPFWIRMAPNISTPARLISQEAAPNTSFINLSPTLYAVSTQAGSTIPVWNRSGRVQPQSNPPRTPDPQYFRH